MRTRFHLAAAGAAAIALAGCTEPTSSADLVRSASVSDALATTPAGYGDLASSYVGGRADVATGDSTGFCGTLAGRGPGGSAMMGGGLHDAFVGGVAFGRGGGHRGPFGGGVACADATFDVATGRVTCAPRTLPNGLTVTRSASYADANGTVQPAFDSLTTDRVNQRSTVTGTVAFSPRGAGPRGDGGRRTHGPGGAPLGGPGRLLGDTARILSASIVVSSSSDRTVTGLVLGSARRMVNGVSQGSEVTTGVSSRGAFTATRTIADTTSGVVIAARAYPSAGSVTRTMTASVTVAGASPVSVTRREVVTYDGSATAKVSITENGRTRQCTHALPRGRLVCE